MNNNDSSRPDGYDYIICACTSNHDKQKKYNYWEDQVKNT